MRKKKKKDNFWIFLSIIPLFLVFLFLVFLNIKLWRERKENKTILSLVMEEYTSASHEIDYLQEKEKERNVEEEIERIARKQLLLKKEGENVIIITKEEKAEEKEEENEEEEKNILERIINIFKKDDSLPE